MTHLASPLGKENNNLSDESDPMSIRSKSSVPKKTMEASALLAKHARGRSAVDTTPFRRRGSEMMKYSSISPSERRPPSAKTISDQCFSRQSPTPPSSPESLLVDSYGDDEQSLAESYALDETEASPESRAIMTEMEKVVQSSPIPTSYLVSPPKKSPALPEIVLKPNSCVGEKVSVPKKNIEASELLAKQGKGRKATNQKKRVSSARSSIPTKGFAATKAAYGGPKQNRRLSSAGAYGKSSTNNSNNRNSTAPTAGGKSLELGAEKPVALAVQREKQQRRERLKDAESTANEADGRRNLDKRTARLRYGDDFKSDIMQHRQNHPYLNGGSNHSDKDDGQIQDRAMNGVSIAVRKRPLFRFEIDRGDYDIISVDNTNGTDSDAVVVHNCLMHADMKTMLMKPTTFPVTAAFDEHTNDDDMYKHIAKPLLYDAVNGGVATILMYGQTGCGKSHTMLGIETRTSHGLFQAIESEFGNKAGEDRPVVTMQFVELCGSKECRDLLVNKSRNVKLAEDEDGSVKILNAASFEVTSPEDLLGRINIAKGRRATEATEKNGVSSRSHAVCQLQIKGSHGSRGLLTLIDCAGSERRHDSMYHSSERQKESAEINASLYSLKECIRARANKNTRIPFRSSSLTRILKESFEREGACLCVIACVAPNASDTEHSLETLKTVANIVGVCDQIREEKAHTVVPQRLDARPTLLSPKQYDHETLKRFLAHKKMTRVHLTEKHDGKALMKMSVPQMRAHLFEDRDKDLAQKLFETLRKENDRVANIQRKERAILKKERKGRL